jgi:hypothetical protein
MTRLFDQVGVSPAVRRRKVERTPPLAQLLCSRTAVILALPRLTRVKLIGPLPPPHSSGVTQRVLQDSPLKVGQHGVYRLSVLAGNV